MTKHIVGLIFFTFIIGSSAFIAGLFAETPQARSFKVRKKYDTFKRKKRKKRHCRKRKPRFKRQSLASAKVTQAVFNPKTGQLTTAFDFVNVDSRYNNNVLKLHFFVSDKYGTRYLKTDNIFTPVKDEYMISSYDWLSNLSSRENLYVIAEMSKRSKWTNRPNFDITKATPVIVKSH